jgi:predicted transcriptional regulator
MAVIPAELQDIAAKVLAGDKGQRASVRRILEWFGKSRRGWRVTRRIRAAMDQLGIDTIPDFDEVNIDWQVAFGLKNWIANGWTGNQFELPPSSESGSVSPERQQANNGAVISELSKTVKPLDPILRVRRLIPNKQTLLSVAPTAASEYAVSLMLLHNFSQLPVACGERSVKGMFSWESYGEQAALNRPRRLVSECMEPHHEISADASLFEAVRLISEHRAIIVRDETNQKMIGIITAADISQAYFDLAEPFFLLGQIENHVRNLIARRFTLDELRDARDEKDSGRDVDDVSDLTIGEICRLLQREESWQKLDLQLDRRTFVGELDEVREIRNDVMHFNPDPLGEPELDRLRRFNLFLTRLNDQ